MHYFLELGIESLLDKMSINISMDSFFLVAGYEERLLKCCWLFFCFKNYFSFKFYYDWKLFSTGSLESYVYALPWPAKASLNYFWRICPFNRIFPSSFNFSTKKSISTINLFILFYKNLEYRSMFRLSFYASSFLKTATA